LSVLERIGGFREFAVALLKSRRALRRCGGTAAFIGRIEAIDSEHDIHPDYEDLDLTSST
jgi:hypothetical protein